MCGNINKINAASLREEPNVYSPKVNERLGKLAGRVIKHVAHHTYVGLVAAVKIVAEIVFWGYLNEAMLKRSSSLGESMVILAPIYEEIVFRGIIQRGIDLCQKIWHQFGGKGKLTLEDRKAQQVFRIRLSALIFASTHLFIPHPNYFIKLLQFGWTFLVGMTYGNLSEKYSTLSPSMVAHGLNNALVFSILSKTHVTLKLLAIAINELFWYALTFLNLPQCDKLFACNNIKMGH